LAGLVASRGARISPRSACCGDSGTFLDRNGCADPLGRCVGFDGRDIRIARRVDMTSQEKNESRNQNHSARQDETAPHRRHSHGRGRPQHDGADSAAGDCAGAYATHRCGTSAAGARGRDEGGGAIATERDKSSGPVAGGSDGRSG